MADLLYRTRLLTGTPAEWAAHDLVLGDGEVVVEETAPGIRRAKVGDGATPFSLCPYLVNPTTITGPLIYRGTIDATGAPPASPAAGDLWISTTTGTVGAGWTGAAGQPVNEGDQLIYDGTTWTVAGSSLRGELAEASDPSEGAQMIGVGPLDYSGRSVGNALPTVIWGDGVADVSPLIAAANARGKPILFRGVAHFASPATITVPIVDTMAQIFTPASLVKIDNGQNVVRPEWWGPVSGHAGMIRYAVNALTDTNGGTVMLALANYLSGYSTAVGYMFADRGGTPGLDYMIKKHVRIQGEKLPEFNSSESALVNGSIVKGTFYMASECDGLYLDKFGVDVGIDYLTSIGVTDADGLCVLQVNKASPYYGSNIRIGEVVGLGPGMGGGALGHACLFESMDGGRIDFAEARRHNHGVVIKSKNASIGTLIGRRNHGEDVILKSDFYAEMGALRVAEAVSEGYNPGPSPGYGILVLAEAASGGNVHIASAQVDRVNYSIHFQATGANLLTDVTIGETTIRSCPIGPKWMNVNTMRCRIGKATVLACPNAVVSDGTAQDLDNGIDNLTIVNSTYGVDATGYLRLGNVHIEDTTFGIYHRALSARIFVGGSYTTKNVANPNLVTPTLTNSWANANPVSNDNFNIAMRNGEFVMEGLIAAGTNGNFGVVAEPLRPSRALRFGVEYYNGSAYTLTEVLLATNGQLSIAAGAVPSGHVSLRNVRWAIPF